MNKFEALHRFLKLRYAECEEAGEWEKLLVLGNILEEAKRIEEEKADG
jgi:hypothetical protein